MLTFAGLAAFAFQCQAGGFGATLAGATGITCRVGGAAAMLASVPPTTIGAALAMQNNKRFNIVRVLQPLAACATSRCGGVAKPNRCHVASKKGVRYAHVALCRFRRCGRGRRCCMFGFVPSRIGTNESSQGTGNCIDSWRGNAYGRDGAWHQVSACTIRNFCAERANLAGSWCRPAHGIDRRLAAREINRYRTATACRGLRVDLLDLSART